MSLSVDNMILVLQVLSNIIDRYLVNMIFGSIGTFQADTDYHADGRPVANVSSQEECCALCAADAQCVVGVLAGSTCWFKYSDEEPVHKVRRQVKLL